MKCYDSLQKQTPFLLLGLRPPDIRKRAPAVEKASAFTGKGLG